MADETLKTSGRSHGIALLGCLALAGALACSCGDDGGGNGSDAGADTDTGADAGTDAGTGASYDFAAAAPWYICPTEPLPADAIVVTAFDRVDQYFGDEDLRTVQAEVELPSESGWAQVGLWFELECPESGNCDSYDRVGSVQLVQNPEDDPAEWEYLSLARHVTPFGMGMCEFIDVTPLASVLTGTRTLTSFIDTWVGPGGGVNGEGWRVTVKLVYFPGEPAPANDVVNVWGDRTITVGEVDAGLTVDDQVDPAMVPIPAEATQILAHLTTTGHSWGTNTLNCAEFCELRQDLYVNGTLFSSSPWRSDCESNPVSPQGGTWLYDRNGWCPGSIVTGQIIDITGAVDPGADNEINFDIRLPNGDEYVNATPEEWRPNEIVALKMYVFE
jgi:hypothetical protein